MSQDISHLLPASLEDIRSAVSRFEGTGSLVSLSKDARQTWINELMYVLNYDALSREDKGLVRTYIQNETRYSRAQTARLIRAGTEIVTERVEREAAEAQQAREDVDEMFAQVEKHSRLLSMHNMFAVTAIALLLVLGAKLVEADDSLKFLNGNVAAEWLVETGGVQTKPTFVDTATVAVRTVRDDGAVHPLFIQHEELAYVGSILTSYKRSQATTVSQLTEQINRPIITQHFALAVPEEVSGEKVLKLNSSTAEQVPSDTQIRGRTPTAVQSNSIFTQLLNNVFRRRQERIARLPADEGTAEPVYSSAPDQIGGQTQNYQTTQIIASAPSVWEGFSGGQNGQVIMVVDGIPQWTFLNESNIQELVSGYLSRRGGGSGRGGGGGGSTGAAGADGATGATGPQGPAGADGAAGPTLGIYNSLILESSGGLEAGNASGQNLFNLGLLTASGQLIVEDDVRFNSGVTLAGVKYNFPIGDGASTGKVLKTDGNGNLSWSDDNSAVLNVTTGQGLTANGSNIRLNAAFSGTTIEAVTLLSGAQVYAADVLRSSGALVVEGRSTFNNEVTFGSGLIIEGITYRFPQAQGASGTVLATDGNGNLTWTTGGSNTYAGQGLTKTGDFISLSASITGSTLEFQTVSGSALTATNSLATSGTLVAEGVTTLNDEVVFGSGIVINGVTYRFPFGDGTSSGKVLKTDGNGNLSWSDDNNSGGSSGGNTGTGSLQAFFDSRYVQVSGDTMTGALELAAGASGTDILAINSLRSSGTLVVDGTTRLDDEVTFGSGIIIEGITYRFPQAQGASGTVLATDGNGNLTWTTGGSNTYAGQGLTKDGDFLALSTTITGSLLEFTTVSGASVRATDLLTSSGGLIVEGNTVLNGTLTVAALTTFNANVLGSNAQFSGSVTGSILQAATTLASSGSLQVEGAANIHGTLSGNTIVGFNLTDCDNATTSKLLWDATTQRFSCGSDQGGSNAPQAGQGLSLDGNNYFSLNTTISGSLLEFTTVSGASVRATDLLTSSGQLVVEGNGIFNSNVGIGTASPDDLLHVFGGSAGAVDAFTNSHLVVENDSSAYIQLLTPDSDERGIFFGEESSNIAGGIIYNNNGTVDGLQFRTNGNVTRVVIDANGNLGVGTDAPSEKLEVIGTISGSQVYAADTLRSSGSLVVEGTTRLDDEVTFGSGIIIEGITYRFPLVQGGSGTVLGTDGNGNLTWTAAGSSYYAGQGLSLNGSNFFSLNAALTGTSLEIAGQISGSSLRIQDEITSSGAVVIDAITPVIVGGVKDNTNLANAAEVEVVGQYAYVASRTDDSLQIIDVSNPTSPTIVGEAQDASLLNGPFAVRVSGRYAYVANFDGNSMAVVDVSSPANPVIVGSLASSTYLTQVRDLDIAGGYAYIAANGANDFTVIDISDPTNPTVAGAIALSSGGFGVEVQGKYAFVKTNTTLQSIDISDPRNPVALNSVAVGTSTARIAVVDNYAYVPSFTSGQLDIVDISNPYSLSIADTVTGLTSAISVDVAGDFAYVAAYGDNSVTVVDVSDPTNAIELGSLTNASDLTGVHDIKIAGRYAYTVNYLNNSMRIIDLGGLDANSATIDSLAVETLNAAENVRVGQHLLVDGYANIGNGLSVQGNTVIRSLSGAALEVVGTVSGSTVYATDILASSGALSVNGDSFLDGEVTFGSGIIIQGITYRFPQAQGASGTVLATDGNGNLTWTTGGSNTYAGQGLTKDGDFLALSTTITGSLLEFTTVSGASVRATDLLTSSGSAIIENTLTVNGDSALQGVTATTLIATLVEAQTLSGATIRAQDFLASSGALSIEGITTLNDEVTFGSGIIINGVTYIFPFGDGSASGRVLATDGNGNLSWTAATVDTDTHFSGTGSLQAFFDNRYVNTSGDTMTGALELAGGASGTDILAINSLRSSGTLVVDGTTRLDDEVTFGSGIIIQGITYRFPQAQGGSGTVLGTDGNGNLTWTAAGQSYYAGQGLTLDGNNFFSLNSTITGALVNFQTVSGSALKAATSLTTSGTLVTEGNATLNGSLTVGSTITLNGVTYTFPVGDGTSSGKVLATDGAGNLSWTTDLTSVGGGGGGSAVIQEGDVTVVQTGSTLDFNASDFDISESPQNEANIQLSTSGLAARLDSRYVTVAGDTMSGGLLLINGGDDSAAVIDTGLLLEVSGTASGRVFHAQDLLTSSGGLIVEGNTVLNGTLTVAGLSTFAAITGTDAVFSGTVSGSSLYAVTSLNSSGTLNVEGTANIHGTLSGNTIAGFNLTDCQGTSNKLVYNAAEQRFECATDQNTGQTYSAGQGLTEANNYFSLNTTITGSLLEFTTVSGASVRATDLLTSSGSAIIENTLTVNGDSALQGVTATTLIATLVEAQTLSGATIRAQDFLASSGALSIEGITTLNDEVTFGSGIIINGVTYIFPFGDGSASGRVLATDGNGNLSWTAATVDTDTHFSGTGSLQAFFDNRYVRTSGDTMTGALIITPTTGTLALEAEGVLSGATIRAQDALASSGRLVVEQDARFNSGVTIQTPTNTSTAFQVLDSNGGDAIFTIDTTNGQVAIGESAAARDFIIAEEDGGDATIALQNQDTGTTSVDGFYFGLDATEVVAFWNYENTNMEFGTNGLTRMIIEAGGDVGIGTSDATEKLEVIGVMSGTTVYAADALRSSGALMVEGTSYFADEVTFGSGIIINGITYVFPAVEGGSGTVLATDGDGQLTWTTVSAGGSSFSGTGSLQAFFDNRYVRTSGGTMTGALIINPATGDIAIEASAIISGTILRAQDTLASSGSLQIEGAANIHGTLSGNTLAGFGLTDCDADGKALQWDATTQTFSCATVGSSSGGGGWTLIETQVASSDATIDFTTSIDSTYDQYRVEFINVVPATDNVDLMARVSNDAGSTWQSDASDYRWSVVSLNTFNYSIADTELTLTADSNTNYVPGSDTGEAVNGSFTLYDPSDTTLYKYFGWDLSFAAATTYTDYAKGGGSYDTVEAINGIRFFFESGNIESGTFKLYALSDTAGASSGVSLQTGYYADADGNNATIELTNADGSLRILNPASGGTASGAAVYITNLDTSKIALEVYGVTSGTVLHAQDLITSSGALVVEGTSYFADEVTFGSGIIIQGITYRFPQAQGGSGTVLGTDGNGNLTWTAAGQSYYAGQGLTLDGNNFFALNSTITGSLLEFTTVSGASVRATDLLTSSGQLIVEGNTVLNGTLTVAGLSTFNANIVGTNAQFSGSVTGSILQASTTLASSGSLQVEGAANIHGTLSGNTIVGFNLTDCDNATNSKLLWDATTQRFSCGSDQGGSNAPQAAQGLSLDGNNYFSLNTTITGSLLEFTTVSGASVRATDLLTSSGSAIIENTLTVNGDSALQGVTATTLIATLVEAQTLSGATIRAQDFLASSGALSIEGITTLNDEVTFGSGIIINGVTYIFPFGDGSASGRVLATDGNGNLSWTAATVDTDTHFSGTGSLQAFFDNRYVNTSGDTMTGSLTVLSTGNIAAINLQTGTTTGDIFTISGSSLTSGTAFRIPNLNALTTGTGVYIGSASEDLTTGSLFEVNHETTSATLSTLNGALTSITSERVNTGTDPLDDYDLLYLKRTNTADNSATYTTSGSVLRIEKVTSGGIDENNIDYTRGLEIVMSNIGPNPGYGDALYIDNNNIVTSHALNVFHGNTGEDAVAVTVDSSSFSKDVLSLSTNEEDNASFNFLNFISDADGTPDTEFTVDQAGNIATDGTLGVGIGGGATPDTQLEVVGTISGSQVYAADTLRSSGALVVEGNATFNSTITIGGVTYTFPSSDGSASGKVLATNGAGQLSWTDGGSSGGNTGTGSLQSFFDNRYVNVSGDTMTGALIIINQGVGDDADLEVVGMISGSVIHAQDQLTSSGTLIVDADARFQNATDSTTGFQVFDADGGNAVLTIDTTNERVGIGTNSPSVALDVNGDARIVGTDGTLQIGRIAFSDRTSFSAVGLRAGGNAGTQTDFTIDFQTPSADYAPSTFTINGQNARTTATTNLDGGGLVFLAGDGASASAGDADGGIITLNGGAGYGTGSDGDILLQTVNGGNVGIGAATPSEKLEVVGTISGSQVYAADMLRSSGSLVVEGNATFNSTITIGGVTYTFPVGDGSASGKVLKTNGAGQLSWSDDNAGSGGGSFSGTGSLQAFFDNRYVNTSGDTMTGALIINPTTGDIALEAVGIISGSHLHAQDLLTSSGTLIVESSTKVGSGAVRVTAAEYQTGAYLFATGAKVIALNNSHINSGSGQNAHIAFGYNDVFDVDLYREGAYHSGGLVVHTESARKNASAFRIVTDWKQDDNTVFRVGVDGALRTSSGATFSGSLLPYADDLFDLGSSTQRWRDLYLGPQSLHIGQDGDEIVLSYNSTRNDLNFSQAISGSSLHISQNLTVSGALTFEGSSVFNDTITLNGVTYMFPYGDGTSSGKVLKTNGAGQLVWSDDTDTDTDTHFSGTGSLQAFFDNRYVNTSGDTMTGALVINPESGSIALEASAIISGTTLRANDLLTSSGSAIIENTLTVNGDSALQGVTATTLIATLVEAQTLSGATIRAQNFLASSGALSVEGITTLNDEVTFGSGIIIEGITYRFPQAQGASGTVLATDGSGNLTWTTATVSAGQGLTSNGNGFIYLNSTITGSLLEFTTVSGASVRATDLLTSSGTLVVEGIAYLNGNVLLGDSSSDTITFNGLVNSNIIPSATNTYDLGSTTNRWRDLYLSGGTIHLGQDGDSAAIGYDVTNDRITFDPDGDGEYEVRISDIGSLDLAELALTPATATGYVRLFARDGTAGGNDDNTVFLGDTETSSSLTDSGIGSTSTASFGGGCRTNSTDQAKFGTQSLKLSCSGYQAYRSYPSGSDIDFESGNFTVDLWAYEGSNTSARRWLIDYNGYNDLQWGLLLNSSNQLEAQVRKANGTTITLTDASTFTTGSWVHIALERDGNTFTLYKNGSSVATTSDSSDLNAMGTAYLMFGNRYPYNASGDQNFSGYLDEIRISNVARYSGNFTVESAAYSEDNSGLYFRDGKGNIIQILDSSTNGAGTEIQNIWTLNDDATITYNFGNVGIGVTSPETELEVVGTISGSQVYAADMLRSSGALIVEGEATFNDEVTFGSGIFLLETGDIPNLLRADANRSAEGNSLLNIEGAWNGSTVARIALKAGSDTVNKDNGSITFSTAEDSSTLVARMIIGENGNVGIGTGLNAADTPLEVVGVISGSQVYAADLLRSSGALIVEGNARFNSTITIGGVTYTFPSSDGSSSGKVLATDGAGNLSWTAAASGGSTSAGQGLTSANGFVSLNSTITGSTLEFQTISGTTIHANNSLTVSGSLVVDALNDPVIIGGIQNASTLNSIRGMAVVGNYAYVGAILSDSLHVIDITDPTAPEIVGTLQDATNLNGISDVYVQGHYAYTANDDGKSISIVDISNPKSPTLVGNLTDTVNLVEPREIAVAGRYAYVADHDGRAFRVIDVYDPANPVIAGGIDDDTNLYGANAVHVAGKYAYVANNFDDSLQIIDIADPTNPRIVGSVKDATNLESADDVVVAGRYAYVVASTNNSLRVIDVSDPTSPSIVGGVKDDTNLAGAFKLTVAGHYAYVATLTNDSLRIIDISDPTLPVIVGGIKDASLLDGASYVEVVGRYAYVSAAVGDAFRVIDLGGIDAANADIGALEAGTLHVLSNGNFDGSVNIMKTLSVGGGLQVYGPSNFMSSSGVVMTINMNQTNTGGLAINSGLNDSAASPHILFGYNNAFDSRLYRSGTGELTVASNTGTTFVINTEMTNANMNAFMIISDVAGDEDRAFRIQADGKVFSDGAYNSTGADYAEWFKVNGVAEEGDVVCIDVSHNNTVRRCDDEADSNVMGIVSTNPAFIGNVISGADGIVPNGYELIGLIGQVPAKVLIAPYKGGVLSIHPGDALTTADKPGYARRALPGEPTVGVALEAFTGSVGDEGSVNVLISRRNSSVTVETVEQEVLDQIAAMEIEDEVEIMVADAVAAIDYSDDILTAVRQQIDTIDITSIVENLITDRFGTGALVAANNTANDDGEVEIDWENLLGTIHEQMNTLSSMVSSLSGAIATQSRDANFDTVGIEENLIIGGDARAASDLYVDGTLHVDDLFIPGLVTLDGSLSVGGDIDAGGRITAEAFTVNSGAVIHGPLSIDGKLLVDGKELDLTGLAGSGGFLNLSNLLVQNALHVMGNITIEGMADILGDVNVGGDLTVSGSLIINKNQAGYAVIVKTGTAVTVQFGSGTFPSIPLVTASSDSFTPWRIRNTSGTGFTIQVAEPAEEDITFTWHAMLTEKPGTFKGLPAGVSNSDKAFLVDQFGVPISSSDIWNACVRSQQPLGLDGQPFNCRRYHDGEGTWTHPDLLVEFFWDPNNERGTRLQIPDGYYLEVVVDETVEKKDEPTVQGEESSSSESSSSSSSSATSESSASEESSSVESSQSSSEASSEASSEEAQSSSSSSETSVSSVESESSSSSSSSATSESSASEESSSVESSQSSSEASSEASSEEAQSSSASSETSVSSTVSESSTSVSSASSESSAAPETPVDTVEE